jgi:hypothetical protein
MYYLLTLPVKDDLLKSGITEMTWRSQMLDSLHDWLNDWLNDGAGFKL